MNQEEIRGEMNDKRIKILVLRALFVVSLLFPFFVNTKYGIAVILGVVFILCPIVLYIGWQLV